MKISKAILKTITLSSLLILGPNSVLAANQEGNPDQHQTPVSGKLSLSENGGFNPNPPSDLNEKTSIANEYFGIAYMPKSFNFGTQQLSDTVNSQQIHAQTNNKTLNVGVKDKRRENTQNWSLSVKHDLNLDNGYQGVTLTIPTKESIRRNMNRGDQEFQSDELIDQVKKNHTDEVKKETDIQVTREEKTIMHTTGGQFVNGVYDLELGDVTLDIPDASKIPAQELSGKVEWTLSNTPMKQSYLTEEVRNLFKDGNCTSLKTDIRCTEVKAAKDSIEVVEDSDQKEYNKEYFEKYVTPCFVEWDILGNYNSGEDIYVGNAKYFKQADNSRAGIFFNKTTSRKPHDGIGLKDDVYLRFSIIRGNKRILNKEFLSWDTSTWSDSYEVQPDDIIEIYHREGTGHRLTAYPNDYKNSKPYEASELTLKFRVDKDLSLKSFERN